MAEETVKGTRVIRLLAGVSLYEEKAAPILEQLLDEAEAVHDGSSGELRGILLLQPAPTSDNSSTWLAELEHSRLLDNLAATFETLRWLLSLIRNSPIPWVYAASDNCFGSHWELALSCQRRLWFDREAKLGFPEVAVGAFPPGGVIESLNKRVGKTQDRWQTKPVFKVSEAVDEGLLHFASDASDWEKYAMELFGQILQFDPRAGVRGGARKGRREDPERGGVDAGRQLALEQLEQVWRDEKPKPGQEPSAWDYCWQLVKERGKLKDSRDLGRLVSHISARHCLGTNYRSWIASGVIKTQKLKRVHRAPVYVPPLMIDLDQLAPPTSVVERLLDLGSQLVFASADGRSLVTALDLIYSRLERAVSSAKAQIHWNQQITWFQGVIDDQRHMTLRFTVHDRLMICHGERHYEFLRLEGNTTQAKCGLLEWSDDSPARLEEDPAVFALVHMVADGYLKDLPIGSGRLPLSVYLRFLFFEEILRITKYVDNDLAAAVQSLDSHGWRFAGQVDMWDRFLRMNHDVFPYGDDFLRLASTGECRVNWEIGSWKHARVFAKKKGSESDRRWNGTAISQHMGAFMGVLARLLHREGVVESLEDADLLCLRSVGFPPAYGTPLSFLRRRGRRRIEYYSSRHWPAYDRSIIWEPEPTALP